MRLGDVVEQASDFWDHDPARFSGDFPYIEISAVELGTDDYAVAMVPVDQAPSRARMVVSAGDIIVSTTRPHRGAIARVRPEDDGCIVSTGFAILRNLKTAAVSKDYLLNVLMSPLVLRQFQQRSSGGNYPAITPDEIDNVLIPVPKDDIQANLLGQLEQARTDRKAKLAQADALLRGIDDLVLSELDLSVPIEDGRAVFAVRQADLRGKRLDPPAYRPFFEKGKALKTPTKALEQVAFIDQNKVAKPAADETLVPYVGLPECDDTRIREVTLRSYKEVKGRSVALSGDILFARIEPSVFNKKYVLANDLKGHSYAYTSTEFYVVRADPAEVVQEYLYAMFFCSFVYAQVKGKTTGSSGRRRIDPELFRQLQVPVPKRNVQERIAAEVVRRHAEAERIRAEAAALWAKALEDFEGKLLAQPFDSPKCAR